MPRDLLRDADVAMYRAKEKGRDRIELFHPLAARPRQRAPQARPWSCATPLTSSQFFLVYQPFFSLEDHSLVGVEALVRWQHPERGRGPPG